MFINYSIDREPLPVVICNLEANETMITEKGAMSWMSPNMQMETTSNGGIGKMFGRAFSGESMFVNRYTARNGNGLIAFASSFPGSIRAFEIAPGQEIIAQKSAFLASSASVEMSIFFQKRFGSGLFGGDTQGQGTDLTIGSGSYIDDFEDQLIGAHPGDKVEVKVTFPENYGNDELNGKEATFKVTVNGIYE